MSKEQESLFLRSPLSLGLSIPYAALEDPDTIVVEDLYIVKKAKIPTFGTVEEQLGEGRYIGSLEILKLTSGGNLAW